MSFFSGLSRPARGAGLALIAVAVIAAVVGGVTLLTGDDGTNTVAGAGPDNGKQATSSASKPGQPTPAPSSEAGTSAQPTTSSAPATSKPTPAPGRSSPSQTPANGQSGTSGAADSADGAQQVRSPRQKVAVRVYNNSTIEGLASRAATDLRQRGWQIAKVSNYPWGIIPKTTAYYRPGTPEKAAALTMAAAFGMRAKPRFDGIKDASPGVIVIVTKNYEGPMSKTG